MPSPLAPPLAFSLGGADIGLSPMEARAFRLLLSLWPPGAWHELYDVDNTRSSVAQFFAAEAQALDLHAAGVLRRLRAENDPSACVERLPDWERALALPATRVPPATTAGRQAAVVSRLRESGSSYSVAEIRAIVAPLLGYADPATLAVLECDRSALRDMHLYANGAGVLIAGGGTVEQSVEVRDDGRVSVGGARVRLDNFTSTAAATFLLIAPDGTEDVAALLDPVVAPTVVARRFNAFNARPIIGTWRLVVGTTGNLSASSWDLFVEGATLDPRGHDGRAAAQWYFAIYANPALEAAAGPSDHDAARRALERIKPAHTRSAVVTTVAPVPGALLPSEFVPAA